MRWLGSAVRDSGRLATVISNSPRGPPTSSMYNWAALSRFFDWSRMLVAAMLSCAAVSMLESMGLLLIFQRRRRETSPQSPRWVGGRSRSRGFKRASCKQRN